MIDHKDTLSAANAEPEVAQTHSAHVKNTGTVTSADELSEEALDDVAGGWGVTKIFEGYGKR